MRSRLINPGLCLVIELPELENQVFQHSHFTNEESQTMKILSFLFKKHLLNMCHMYSFRLNPGDNTHIINNNIRIKCDFMCNEWNTVPCMLCSFTKYYLNILHLIHWLPIFLAWEVWESSYNWVTNEDSFNISIWL